MLTKIPKTIQTSELRKNLARYLKDADEEPVFVSKERGSGASVIIGADIYNRLLDAAEVEPTEQERKAIAKGREDFKKGNFLTLDEVRKQLGITAQ